MTRASAFAHFYFFHHELARLRSSHVSLVEGHTMFGFKPRLGSIRLFFCFFIIDLWLLSFSRLGLAFWQSDRVSQADGWLHLLLQGIRVDVSTLCWLFGVPMALSLLLGADNRFGKTWLWFMRGLLVASTLLLLFLELSTLSIY